MRVTQVKLDFPRAVVLILTVRVPTFSRHAHWYAKGKWDLMPVDNLIRTDCVASYFSLGAV